MIMITMILLQLNKLSLLFVSLVLLNVLPVHATLEARQVVAEHHRPHEYRGHSRTISNTRCITRLFKNSKNTNVKPNAECIPHAHTRMRRTLRHADTTKGQKTTEIQVHAPTKIGSLCMHPHALIMLIQT